MSSSISLIIEKSLVSSFRKGDSLRESPSYGLAGLGSGFFVYNKCPRYFVVKDFWKIPLEYILYFPVPKISNLKNCYASSCCSHNPGP